MPGFQGSFDANQFNPEQGGTKHPVGNKFPATISNTSIDQTKSGDGGLLNVEFVTAAGKIRKSYNLWNPSAQAVEIAQKQLSALCYATGIFKLNWENEGAALRGGRCCIDVQFQAGQEPTAEKLQGGYVEVSKVYDANGNEPGKAPQQQQPAMQQPNQQPAQPLQQQSGGGWGNQPAQPTQGGWNNQPQQQPVQQPNPAPGPGSGGWQQQPQGSNPGGPAMTPPWGQR